MHLTDPFLMCVHHRHSFHAWDPFRALQARFFPEGAFALFGGLWFRLFRFLGAWYKPIYIVCERPMPYGIHERHPQTNPAHTHAHARTHAGFPAHPHSGFNTLTYVLKGKMRHRDSMGVKQVNKRMNSWVTCLGQNRVPRSYRMNRKFIEPTQVYGDGAAQFLTAGGGVLHEEM